MCSYLPMGEWKLLYSSSSKQAGWFQKSALYAQDCHPGCRSQVHFPSKISLWIEPNWNGTYSSFPTSNRITNNSKYWGWCKYRYREVPKKTFNEAKQSVREILDACPMEVIQRFINRSWRFMSAYRLGLTGKAAEWAVRKQKQHRQVSQSAMMSIEAVLDS